MTDENDCPYRAPTEPAFTGQATGEVTPRPIPKLM